MAGGLGGGLSSGRFGPDTSWANDIGRYGWAAAVPTLGNFCGPGWTDGVRDKAEQDRRNFTTPALNAIDKICKAHDQDYGLAAQEANLVDRRAATVTADATMVGRVVGAIASGNTGLAEGVYGAAAAVAFTAKAFLLGSVAATTRPSLDERHPELSQPFRDLAYLGSGAPQGRYVQALDAGDTREAARLAGQFRGCTLTPRCETWRVTELAIWMT